MFCAFSFKNKTLRRRHRMNMRESFHILVSWVKTSQGDEWKSFSLLSGALLHEKIMKISKANKRANIWIWTVGLQGTLYPELLFQREIPIFVISFCCKRPTSLLFFYTKDTFIFSGWSEILQDRWCKFAGLQKSWCSVLPFHFHLSRLSVSELIDGCNLQAAVPKTYLDVRCSTFTFTFPPFIFEINRLFQFSLSQLIYYPNFQASCFDTALSLFSSYFHFSNFQASSSTE